MTDRVTRGIVVAVGIVYWTGRTTPQASAQGVPSPLVPVAARAEAARVRAAVLKQKISLELQHVTLKTALGAVASAGHMRLTYSPYLVPTRRVVSLAVDTITVGDALNVLLRDTGIDVFVAANGWVTLERAEGAASEVARSQPSQGTVSGSVVDSATRTPIPQVSVQIEGTRLGAVSGADGKYTIVGATAGDYRVTARRLGYVAQTRTVTVTNGQPTVLNFALNQPATRLDEVVTTALGEQRRYEIGNDISTINADSLSRTAPVTNLTDLLSGRTPNVEVLQNSGIVGDGPAIRIRGPGSFTVSNDPIVIIDGVRADPSPGGTREIFGNLGGGHPTASRLNDLNPDEIESIEVLRGPSAATEYGTDAANGVIVVKTKRGHAGAPRWDLFTDQAISTMPTHFPENYTSWGHTTDGSNMPTLCPYFAPFGAPNADAGTCAVDSVTHFQPLNHVPTSEFGTGHRGKYGAQVSGGGETLRYFFSGGYSGETGSLQMPSTEQARVSRERGELVPNDQLHPDALQQVSLRTRVDAPVGANTDVALSADYNTLSQRTPDALLVLYSALGGKGYRDSLSGYGSWYGGLAGAEFVPGYMFAGTSSESDGRFTGGLSANWHPQGWLAGHGTVGVDDGNRSTVTQVLPGQWPTFEQLNAMPGGYRSRGTYRTTYYTVDLGATGTAAVSRLLTLKTAVGAQYTDHRTSGTAIGVTNIGATNASLNGTVIFNNAIAEQRDEAATLGAYVEQTAVVNDRLFVTGAVREDAGSWFGSQYKAALYPKASVSWIVVPEGRNLLRLRAAYGQSGVQPRPGAALNLFLPGMSVRAGGTVSGDTIGTFANTRLRPERSEEVEGGFDAGVAHNRIGLELTAYQKESRDALIDVVLPGSLGGGIREENLGSVRNRGLEISLTVRPLDTRMIGWSVTTSGSVNQNHLLRLAPGVTGLNQGFYASPYQQRVGYPIYGLWAVPLHYADLNHDGRIEPNEVTQGDSARYVGPSQPVRQVSLSSDLSLFSGRVRVAGQLDYRGGHRLMNAIAFLRDGGRGSAALNNPAASLAEQARAVAYDANAALFLPNSGYTEDASFTRLRELSVTYVVPPRAIRALPARAVSLTLAGRNLALWTRYSGPDPEVNNAVATNAPQTQVISYGVPTPATNHDAVGDIGAVPQLRDWVLKVNIGL